MSNRDFTEYFNEINSSSYSLKDKALKSSGIMFSARIGEFFIQIISTMFLSRLLKPSDFGIFAMVNTITMLLVIFKDLGFTDATIQTDTITENQVNSLFWINIIFGFICGLILILISPLVSGFYDEPALKAVFTVSSLSFLISCFSLQHIALLKRRLQFSKIFIIEFSGTIISQVIAIIFAVLGFRYWALVSRPITVAVISVSLSWIYCKWTPRFPRIHDDAKPLIKFGLNSIGFQITNYIRRIIDKITIGRLFGTETLGFYHKSYYVSGLPVSKLTMSIFHVATSTLSKLKDDEIKYKKYYLKVISILSFVSMPISAFMYFNARELIILFLGNQWINSIEIFSILSLAIGFQVINTTNGWLHISLGRSDRWFRWGLISLATTIISLIIGIRYGVTGIAKSITINTIILTFPSLMYAGRPIKLKIRKVISTNLKYFAAAYLSGFFSKTIIGLLPTTSFLLQIFISLLLIFVLYNIFLLPFFPKFESLKTLLKLVQRLLKKEKGNYP